MAKYTLRKTLSSWGRGGRTAIPSPYEREVPILKTAPQSERYGAPLTQEEKARAYARYVSGKRPGLIEDIYGVTPLEMGRQAISAGIFPPYQAWQYAKSTVIPLVKGRKVEPFRTKYGIFSKPRDIYGQPTDTLITEEQKPQAAQIVKEAAKTTLLGNTGKVMFNEIVKSLPPQIKEKLPDMPIETTLGLAELAINLPAMIATGGVINKIKGEIGQRMGQEFVYKMRQPIVTQFGEEGYQKLATEIPKRTAEFAKRQPFLNSLIQQYKISKIGGTKLNVPALQGGTVNFYAGIPIDTNKVRTALQNAKFSPSEIKQIVSSVKEGAVQNIPSLARTILSNKGLLPTNKIVGIGAFEHGGAKFEIKEKKIGDEVRKDLYIEEGGKQRFIKTKPESQTFSTTELDQVLGKGKVSKQFEVGKSNFYRITEPTTVTNIFGKKVTLPVGEEYRATKTYDGNIRLTDGKQVTVDVKQLDNIKGITLKEGDIKAGGKYHKPEEFTGGKERGFITSVKEKLSDLKVSNQYYIPRGTDELSIKAKNLIKSDINTAEKMALTGSDDKAVATASELLKYYIDKAKTSTNPMESDFYYEKTANIANTIAPKLTEAGRTSQAASVLGILTPEGQLRFAAREIQRYNEEVEKERGGLLGLKRKIPELTGGQAEYISTEMKTIQDMPDGTEKAMRFQKLQNYITDLVPTPLMKKMISIWKAGLLTGIKTTGLNIFANISHVGTEIAKDIPAAMVDSIASVFTGKKTLALSVKGLPQGIKEGIEKGKRYFTTGYDERNIGTKLDYRRMNFGKGRLAKSLQTYTDAVFRVMGAEDQPFYYAAKLRSFYEQAKARAINKGLKGTEAQKFIDGLVQNPDEEMVKYASYDAETAVFQNKTALGQAARAIQNIGGGAGEIVVPFGRTPSAVAMQIFNYSPAGIAKTIFENVGKGRFDQRLFSQGMGRGLTGVGVLALGALLFRKGLMTLARPTGEKERKLWELEGKKANAIKIGNKWRTIQMLGPVGNVLIIGGYFQKEFSEKGSPTKAMANVLAGSLKSFTEQTFVTGVNNFLDAVSDPNRSANYVVGRTAASLIPTLVSDIGRATDERERRSNTILENFQARIPGLREKLEPQITVLGEEKKRVGNPLEVMADPTRPSPEKSSLVTQELRRLWDLGFQVSPTLLGDKGGYEGLAPKENTELWKRSGEILNEKLTNLFINETYKKLAEDEKAKTIESFVKKAKIIARVEMVMKQTQGLEGETLKMKLSELKQSGLMTREVFKKFMELR